MPGMFVERIKTSHPLMDSSVWSCGKSYGEKKIFCSALPNKTINWNPLEHF